MLHTMNGFLAAAIGFSLVDVLNRSERTMFNLSPLFVAMVAFCFSMTIGVLWEFFEYFADNVLLLDMQKDTVVHSIRSVALDPTATNTVVTIEGITDVVVNGQIPGAGRLSGHRHLHDTMEDLLVNFIGAVVFCTFGFFYLKGRGKGKFVRRFVPTVRGASEEDVKGD